MKKILIVRLSSGGDIVLTKSVVDILRKNIGNIKIYFLVKKNYIDLMKIINPDKVFIANFGKGFFKDIKETFDLAKKINKEGIEVVLDLHNNIRTFFLKIFLKNLKKYVYKKDVFKRYLMVLFKWFLNHSETVEDKYLKVVERFLKENGNNKIKYISKNKIKNNIKTIILHVDAKWKLKRWYGFYDLAHRLSKDKDVKIIITGLKEEVEKSDKILYIKKKNITNLIGKLNIHKLVKIIKKSDLLICNDTMVAHVGKVFNIPTIVILGPTVSSFGFIDKKNFTIIENNLTCRPCHLHGGNVCPIETFECMNGISVSKVLNAIRKILKNNRKRI